MINQKIIHPYIFAVYAVLFLFSRNIAHTPFEDALLPLIVTQIGAVALYFFFFWIIKDREKAGLETTLVLLLTLSYGHVFLYLVQKKILSYGDQRLLAAVYSAVFILGIWAIWRVFQKTRGVTIFLNLATLVLLIQPLFQIILFQFKNSVENSQPLSFSVNQSLDLQSFPDIYYIVLDGYGSNDIIRTIYDYDNSGFLNFLQNQGFYVAQKSHANYPQTLWSLTSTLNLNYLDQGAFLSQNQAQYKNYLEGLLLNNDVRQFLEEQGYKTISIASGWSPTEWENAANFYNSSDVDINGFKYLYLMTTPALIFQNDLLYDIHRRRILFSFETLKEISTLPNPKFVFAHIVAPHPPFVFNSNGEPIQPDRLYNLRDGNYFEGTTEEYIAGYRGEIEFINYQILESLSFILDNSRSIPVIIIQGDHGPAAYFDWTGLESNSCLPERTGILNAYLYPKDAEKKLYPGITPVNSFRIILNTLFGAEFDLLPDTIYYIDNSNFTFIDISKINACAYP